MFPWSAQPAVVLVNSTVYAGPGANVFGGSPYATFPPLYSGSFMASVPGSYVYHDPRTVLTAFGGVVNAIPADLDAVAIEFAVANDWMRTYIAGPSGGFALLAVGDLAPSPLATPWGSLLIDVGCVTFVDLLHLPTSVSGYVTKDYFVPAGALNAHAYALQALTLSPLGALGLTWATPFCVGWEHGRIP